MKISVIGKHAEARRQKIGQIIGDYESGRKLPRKYASPQKIAQYGRDARLSVPDAIDDDARDLMLPYNFTAGQPRHRIAGSDMERARKKGVTHLRTVAQAAAARRNLERARAARKAKSR